MKKKQRNYLFGILAPLIMLPVLLLLVSCKGDEINTEFPRPNPPAQPASSLILSGKVVDSKTTAGLNGAAIDIIKSDGSKITTVYAGASGNFSYDISQVGVSTYKVSASATGYGTSFSMANVDLVKRETKSITIPLDQIKSSTATVSPSTSTTISIAHVESKNNQNLSLTVPPAAVVQNTSLQLASLQVHHVVTPTNASVKAHVCVVNITPAGITFAVPVKIVFPLPYKFNTTEKIELVELVNNVWQATGIMATLDNTGLIATAYINKSGEYALQDDVNFSSSVTVYKKSEVTDERSFTFSSGILKAELPGVITYSRVSQNVVTEIPTDEWIFNTIAQRFGANFATISAPGSLPSSVVFNVAWPGATANPYKISADGSGNINRPNESGDWSLKIVFENFTDNFANVTLDNPGYWQVTVTGSLTNWREKQRVWVWTAHNQGGVFEY